MLRSTLGRGYQHIGYRTSSLWSELRSTRDGHVEHPDLKAHGPDKRRLAVAHLVNDPTDHSHQVDPGSAMGDGIRTRRRLIIGIVCSSTPSTIWMTSIRPARSQERDGSGDPARTRLRIAT